MPMEQLQRAEGAADSTEIRDALQAALRAANERLWIHRNVARIYRERLDDIASARQVLEALEPLTGIEWGLTARFTNPCFIDDDLLVEPTGRLVETSGVQVATFRGGLLTRVNCYFDDLAIVEQIVT